MKPLTTFILALLTLSVAAQEPPGRTTADQGRIPVFSDSGKSPEISNFKAFFSYESSKDETLRFSGGQVISLPKGTHTLSIIHENPEGADFSLKAFLDNVPQKILSLGSKTPQKSIKPRFDKDFTVWTKFKTTGDGTVSPIAPRGVWSSGAKPCSSVTKESFSTSDGRSNRGRSPSERRQGKNRPPAIEREKVELFLDGKLVPTRTFQNPTRKPRSSRSRRGRMTLPLPQERKRSQTLKY